MPFDSTGTRFPSGVTRSDFDRPTADENAPPWGGLCAGLVLLLVLYQGWVWVSGLLRNRRELYHSPEQVQERRQVREEADRHARVCAAERQARRYYRKHAELLAEECPPELFESLLRSHLPGGVSPEGAWDSSRDIIANLQPIVRRAVQRKAERADAVRKIDREIRALRREEAEIQRNCDEEETRREETSAIRSRILALEEERRETEQS